MTQNNVTQRMIALSKETADLLDSKKMLDELYGNVSNIHDKLFFHDDNFNDKFGDAYATINGIIMELLTEQINIKSTDSNYKLI